MSETRASGGGFGSVSNLACPSNHLPLNAHCLFGEWDVSSLSSPLAVAWGGVIPPRLQAKSSLA
jgi:hypothetical protein